MNVLITGAAGGLGRILAAHCAKRGFNLYLTDINRFALEDTKAGIKRRYDVGVWAEACDLTDESKVEEFYGKIDAAGIKFDMLLNVAGIDFEGSFTGRTAKQVSAIIKLNIEATLNITHKTLERRVDGGRFYIVFVSSLASLYPMPLKACYAASKRFLYDFSYALGNELKPFGVSVMSLCPGGLPTTEEAVHGIAAQGFWGSVTTNRLELIAERTISKVMRGKKVYIPGLLNRTLGIFGGIVPKSFVSRIIYLRWQNSLAVRGADCQKSPANRVV